MLNCRIVLLLVVSTVVLTSQVKGTVWFPPSTDVFRGSCVNNAIGIDVMDSLTISFQPQSPQVSFNPSSITLTGSQKNRTYQICSTNSSAYGAYPVAISMSGPDAARMTLNTQRMTVNVVDPTKIMNDAMSSMASSFTTTPSSIPSIGTLTQNTLPSFMIPVIPSLGNIFGNTFTQPTRNNQQPMNPTILVPATSTTPQISVTPPTTQVTPPSQSKIDTNVGELGFFLVKSTQNSLIINATSPYENSRVYYLVYPLRTKLPPGTNFQSIRSQVEKGNTFYPVPEAGYNLTMENRRMKIGLAIISRTSQTFEINQLEPSTKYDVCSFIESIPEGKRQQGKCIKVTTTNGPILQALLKFRTPINPQALNNVLCKIVDDLGVQIVNIVTSQGEICDRQSSYPNKYFFNFNGNSFSDPKERKIYLISDDVKLSDFSQRFTSMFESSNSGTNMRQSGRKGVQNSEPTFVTAKLLETIYTDDIFAYNDQGVQFTNIWSENGKITFVINKRPRIPVVAYYVRIPSANASQTPNSTQIMNCKIDLPRQPKKYCGRLMITADSNRTIDFPDTMPPNNEKIFYTFATQNPLRPYFGQTVYSVPLGTKAVALNQPVIPTNGARHLLLIPILLLILLL